MNKFTPYPYQEKVGELILSGRNVILQAPTGAGKTAAALLPFLHARRHHMSLR
ncbi:MAG: DEAD/DEAH box helicase [Chloroflexi bacterium]|nr:DEAD/DEAH box helicase [Chloroflexota bacterium]